MADFLYRDAKGLLRRMKDMGDGTYAEVVAGAGGSGGGGGDASAANQAAGNASLTSIDTKTPALVGGAVPVGLAVPSNATATAYARSLVLKAAPGVLYGLSGYNSKTSPQFIQVHDATAEPAANAVPKVLVRVAAESSFSLDFGPRGRAFAAGIVVCNSSTGPTLTIGAADCWIDGQVA